RSLRANLEGLAVFLIRKRSSYLTKICQQLSTDQTRLPFQSDTFIFADAGPKLHPLRTRYHRCCGLDQDFPACVGMLLHGGKAVYRFPKIRFLGVMVRHAESSDASNV